MTQTHTTPYIIFFRGLSNLIDESAAKKLASNRGCEAVFYPYAQWFEVATLPQDNPNTTYHVVGFSRGAAPDVMGGFMKRIRALKAKLPEDIMTVGLYGPKGGGFTPRYMDNTYECINFLDSSGQRHVGEHNAVNLGADVDHLPQSGNKPGNRGGMAIVADMFADGKNPLVPVPTQVKPIEPPQVSQVPPTIIVPTQSNIVLVRQHWPKPSECPKFYGNPGSPGWQGANLVSVPCPWTLNMDKVVLHSIQIHKKCAESLKQVLDYVWEGCGKDQEKINALHFNRYSGSYNYRPIRGGSALSYHAYGAAIDWDDQENQQHSQHHLFTKDTLLIKAFLDAGWTWGGNWKAPTTDAMHVEAGDQ